VPLQQYSLDSRAAAPLLSRSMQSLVAEVIGTMIIGGMAGAALYAYIGF
jgi:hypothetical protein